MRPGLVLVTERHVGELGREWLTSGTDPAVTRRRRDPPSRLGQSWIRSFVETDDFPGGASRTR